MKPKLILASKSPRRQALLKQMGFDFEIKVKSIQENYPSDMKLPQIPVYLARKKAQALEEELGGLAPHEIILTADTMVGLGEQIMGKPQDAQEAQEMLRQLSGKVHEVITGVCLHTKNETLDFLEITKVFFKEVSEQQINAYVEDYQPFDKAGSYGIQEWMGMIAVYKIEGCYYNVMGLPLSKLYQTYQQLEIIKKTNEK